MVRRTREFREAIRASPEANVVADWPDKQLLRFMRAREFNVKKALKLLEDDVEWRKANAGRKIHHSMTEHVMPFLAKRLVRVCGRDKSGRPVVVLRNGEFFPRRVKDSMEVVNIFIFFVEGLVQLIEACGFMEFTAIADMGGWSLTENFSLPVAQLLAQMLQNHFPERLRYAFVINNPWAFSAAWNLISPFLEDRVKAKVHVWGSKLEKLKDYIDADVLEVEHGGTHEPYPVDAEFMQPFMAGKTFVVGPLGGVSELGSAPAAAAPPADVVRELREEDETPMFAEEEEEASPQAHASSKMLVRQQSSATRRRLESLRSRVGASFRRATVLRKASSSTVDEVPLAKPPLRRMGSSAPDGDRPVEVIPKKPRRRVTVLGATGKLGRLVALGLLDNDTDVSALVRVNGQPLRSDLMARCDQPASVPSLQIFIGGADSPIDLDRSLENSDAVVWALGVAPALTGNAAEQLVSVATNLLDAMERCHVRRLVLVSSAHVEDTWWEAGAGVLANLYHKPMFWKTHYQHLKHIEDEVFKRSIKGLLDVTVVRPGELLDQDPLETQRPGVVAEEGFGIKDVGPGRITREALAAFLVEQAIAKDSKFVGKGVAVGFI